MTGLNFELKMKTKEVKIIRSLVFTDGLDEEKFIPFFKELTEVINEYDHINIYFSTIGGSIVLANMFADFINRYKDKITLIIIDGISSAGFITFINAKCKRELLDDAYAMSHKAILDADGRRLLQDKNRKLFLSHWTKESNDREYKTISKYLSTEDLALWRKGQDVYISRQVLQEIIDIQEL